jgi:hypothetical protein
MERRCAIGRLRSCSGELIFADHLLPTLAVSLGASSLMTMGNASHGRRISTCGDQHGPEDEPSHRLMLASASDRRWSLSADDEREAIPTPCAPR